MMFRITQCAAPLAVLLLLATGFAFGTTAEAATVFAGYLAEAVPGIAPTAMDQKTPDAGEQQAMPGADASQKCTPTKTAVHC